MNRRHLLFAPGIFLAGAALPHSAQASATDNTFPRFADLAGIARAISRSYAPASEVSSVAVLQAGILQFGHPPDAEAAFLVFRQLGLRLFASVIEESAVIAISSISGLADEAHRFRIAVGAGGYFDFGFALEGNLVLLSLCAARAEPASSRAWLLLDYLVNQGEASASPAVFDAKGGSTGNLWAIYPPSDHTLLDGLVPDKDEVFAPAA